MNLGQLIRFLKTQNPDTMVPWGFGEPMSYRGIYDHVAFAPKKSVSIQSMLDNCEKAKVDTFRGYKGGDYTYDDNTPVWVAYWGECGENDHENLEGVIVWIAKSC